MCAHPGCGCDGPCDIVRLPAALETREPSVQERTYRAAQIDPVASLILKAMHTQDANTYNGNSGDMGTLALNTAAQIRMLLAGKKDS